LKNKPINPSDNLPEIKVPGTLGQLFHWVSHVKPLYWIIILPVVVLIFLTFIPNHLRMALWSAIISEKALVIMLLIFCLVAISLVWSTGQRIDVWVFMFFNMRGKHPYWLDFMMLGFTQIGNGIFTLAIAFLLFLDVNHLLAYELILGTLTLWLMVELIKVLIRRSRPFIKLTSARIVGNRAGGRSFPSGHTGQAFFTAALMNHYFHTGFWLASLFYAIALLVGITRVYVGMHYPRDVLAGAILGTVWSLIGVIVNSYIFR
jgi:membrane-associated phospholipid phosphatase